MSIPTATLVKPGKSINVRLTTAKRQIMIVRQHNKF